MNLYRIQNINCPLDHDEHYIRGRVAREIGVGPSLLADFRIERRSVDARDKRNIRIVYTVVAGLESPSRSLGAKAAALAPAAPYRFPAPARGSNVRDGHRPIIVGSGPAGLFCALALAEAGYRPIVLERGDDVEARGKAVSSFWTGGELDPESNMQFGEGGAGTFSDGKLTASGSDGSGRDRLVLEEFVAAGAPAEILYQGKPHIGTDYLVRVVAGLRAKIVRLGGTVRFRARVESLAMDGGRVSGVVLEGGERIDSGAVVLAIGHSARDTFAALAAQGVPMERKPFAIGLRVEHPQEMISRAQYGDKWDHPALGAADYKLTHRSADGRGVYSFCMCPGGYVVDASSERGMSACNGMSDFARGSPNANSAIVVAVRPDDLGGDDGPEGALAGVEFQRRWERLARESAGSDPAGGRSALPVQTLEDFVAGKASDCLGGVMPSIRGSYALADLNACLPAFVASGIKEAFPAFDKKIAGFGRPDAVLTGVETRSSSPLRILRDDGLQSSVRGLFPCGEGAGYAGGIMSAATDGIRVAEAVALSSGALLG
ncbi:MAG: hypothetical protein CVV47_12905 [Spirochaetae bacterium HGW-Spirochaetae-3]|jgi:hypothetical protein|nr:MAG: hypothetical protein CVV47_12905 [Spirochaetae bacterium HGW-Spirochaetae-3]